MKRLFNVGKALHCGVSPGHTVLPAGVDVDFGAGSKLLRGVVTLGVAGGAARLAPLGVSLEGRAAFRTGWSSFPKVDPVGGRQCVNYNLMKNGWTLLGMCNCQPIPSPSSALELDLTLGEWL